MDYETVNKLALEMLPVSAVYVFRAMGMATILLGFFRPSLFFEMLKNIKDTEITQKIFNHRSKMNGLSTTAKWNMSLEKQAIA